MLIFQVVKTAVTYFNMLLNVTDWIFLYFFSSERNAPSKYNIVSCMYVI